MVMVLPFIEGRKFRQERPARLFKNPYFQLPPIPSENVKYKKSVGNKIQNTKLKILNYSSPRQRENTLQMVVDNSDPGGKQRTKKRYGKRFSDTDYELPPIFPGKTKPDQLREVWNKLNKTEIKIPSSTSPLLSKEKSERLKLALSNQLVFPGKDVFRSQYIAKPKSIEKTLEKQGIKRLRNAFATITASWYLRKDHATYKTQELNELFSTFGPIKCIRFQSPRHAEIEFVWVTSACLAVRAAQLFTPGKGFIFRRWTHAPLQGQLWDKKESRPK